MAQFLGDVKQSSKDLLVSVKSQVNLAAKKACRTGVIVSRQRDNTPVSASPLVDIRTYPLSATGKALSDCFKSPNQVVDQETGEIVELKWFQNSGAQIVKKASVSRTEKHYRRATAASILGTTHRVNACCKAVLPGNSGVEVHRIKGAGPDTAGHFRGVMMCGSAWLCAVCGSKISEKRKKEIKKAVNKWKESGGEVWLVTYTFPHGRHDKLENTQRMLAEARKRLKRGTEYDEIREDYGILGTIVAHEITHGFKHGWHPHLHELIFVRHAHRGMKALRERLFKKWSRACVLSGLGLPSEEHGVDVRGGSFASAYIAKGGLWGIEDELVKANIKDGRNGSRSIGQILDSYRTGDAEVKAVEGRLFREYARATKGKAQLKWSPGLKAYFGIDDLSDEELMAQDEAPSTLVTSINLDDWKIVVKHRLQALVLESAIQGEDEINRVISLYRDCDRPHFRQDE